MKRLILLIVAAVLLSGCITDLGMLGVQTFVDFVVLPAIYPDHYKPTHDDKGRAIKYQEKCLDGSCVEK